MIRWSIVSGIALAVGVLSLGLAATAADGQRLSPEEMSQTRGLACDSCLTVYPQYDCYGAEECGRCAAGPGGGRILCPDSFQTYWNNIWYKCEVNPLGEETCSYGTGGDVKCYSTVDCDYEDRSNATCLDYVCEQPAAGMYCGWCAASNYRDTVWRTNDECK